MPSNAIIVGTDLTPHTSAIVDEGLKLARALHGHLVLVHAVEPIEDPAEADRDTQVFHEQLIHKAEEALNARRHEWPPDVELLPSVELGSRVEVLVRLVRRIGFGRFCGSRISDDSGPAQRDHVRERDARMLIMGSPFRGSGPPVGIGLQLMAQCPCPVVIVP